MRHFYSSKQWLFCLAMLLSFSVTAQVEVEWDRIYGGEHEDRLRSIAVTADGGYLLGGDSRSDAGGDKSDNSMGAEDFWVVRIDAEGNKLWDRTYGSEYIDYLSTVISLADGGFLLAGRSFADITDPESGETNFRAIRIDADGNIIWDRTYGSMRGDYMRHAIQTDDGGFLLTGTSAGTGGDRAAEPRGRNWDYWAVKIDAEGVLEWERGIAGFSIDYHQTVAQGADGGFLLGGFSASPAGGDKSEGPKGYSYDVTPDGDTLVFANLDYWIVKLDATGNKEWDKTIGGTEDDYLYEIEATPDGGYLLGGRSRSNASADKSEDTRGDNWWDTDMWVVKIDALGNIEWDKTIGGSASESLVVMQPIAGGGYLLGGNSDSPASGDKTDEPEEGQLIWLVWIDEAGNIQRDEMLGKDDATLAAIASPEDHEYLLGAWIDGAETEDGRVWDDYYVMKIRDEMPDETPQPEPTPGHITGAGLFHSPAGAYTPDPFVQGLATFSFLARQQDGQAGVRGHASFRLPHARIHFISRELEWISVQEDRAFIKGTGRLGQEDGYHFLISVQDRGLGARPPKDKFRIIIWNEEDAIVYDNQQDDARYAGAEMEIQVGLIQINRQGRRAQANFVREQEKSFEPLIAESYRVYPSLLNEEGLWLELPEEKGGQELMLSIYDIQGRKMSSTALRVEEGSSRQFFQPAHHNWPKGIYFLHISNGQQEFRQKLMK